MQKFFEAGTEYTASLVSQLDAIGNGTGIWSIVLIALLLVCLLAIAKQKFQQSRALAASTEEPSEFNAALDPHMQEELRRCLNGTLDTEIDEQAPQHSAKILAYAPASALKRDVARALTSIDRSWGKT